MRAATDGATYEATYAATYAATRAATDGYQETVRFLLKCIGTWSSAYNGGNEWASWNCFLSFFRDVLSLHLPEHKNYRWHEQASLSSGPRYMRPEFCMVSDRPELIRVDSDRRLHCNHGPAKRWRDGWSLWYLNGVTVDEQIVMRGETQSLEQIRNDATKKKSGCGSSDMPGWR